MTKNKIANPRLWLLVLTVPEIKKAAQEKGLEILLKETQEAVSKALTRIIAEDTPQFTVILEKLKDKP